MWIEVACQTPECTEFQKPKRLWAELTHDETVFNWPARPTCAMCQRWAEMKIVDQGILTHAGMPEVRGADRKE